MDIIERFSTKFGRWYESLFGGEQGELRPRDILHKLTAAMEDGCMEGLDGNVYVPNKFVLELAVVEADERDYLLSFLDEEELVGVLQNFLTENGYLTRGPLDFTLAEVPAAEGKSRREKLRVKAKFDKGDGFPAANSGEIETVTAGDEDLATVPAVAWAALAVTGPDGRRSHFSLVKPVTQIGRSRHVGNDLVLDTDGLVSKAHARLEREKDGSWTVYDLGSMNGVSVGGIRIDTNGLVKDGDEIVLGETRLVFQGAGTRAAALPKPVVVPTRRARLVAADGESYVLASETLIGRAVTCDIVLPDPSVATKHARIVVSDAATCSLEDLAGQSTTQVNGRVLFPAQRLLLTDGDLLTFGTVEMRFAADSTL